MKKSSYTINDNLLLKLNSTIANLLKKPKNNISYRRCMSFSDSYEKNKINTVKRNIRKKTGENIFNEKLNYPKKKTLVIRAKESKKVLETLETDITSNTNDKKIKEIINESDSDNSLDDYNLDYNSNYNCTNSLNFKEKKTRERKNAFYLNKNITSSISLNTKLLAFGINDSTEKSNKEEEKKQKYKLSQDNVRNANNNYEINTKEVIIKERISKDIDNAYEENDSHQFIINKLKDFNIPYFYYKDSQNHQFFS